MTAAPPVLLPHELRKGSAGGATIQYTSPPACWLDDPKQCRASRTVASLIIMRRSNNSIAFATRLPDEDEIAHPADQVQQRCGRDHRHDANETQRYVRRKPARDVEQRHVASERYRSRCHHVDIIVQAQS